MVELMRTGRLAMSRGSRPPERPAGGRLRRSAADDVLPCHDAPNRR